MDKLDKMDNKYNKLISQYRFETENNSFELITLIKIIRSVCERMMVFPRQFASESPSLEDFILERKLGQGTYGCVSKYIHKQTLLPYAIKRMSYKNKRKSQVLMIQKQIQILYRIRNKYIVQLIDHFEDVENGDIYLVMEFIQGGDLYKSVYNKKVVLEVKDVAMIAWQVGTALTELHANSVIHRDLKLENVIYLPNKSIKLVDLGCSNYYGEDFQRLTKIGTKIYYSPEIILSQAQDDRLDVWCLGVLIYQLLFMRSPFKSNDIQAQIKKLQYEIPIPYHQDQDLVHMFQKIFSYKDKRIRANELIHHPWIVKNVTKDAVLIQNDRQIFAEETIIQLKHFLLGQIEKCEKDIQKLKEDNESLRRKINLEDGIHQSDEEDVF